MGDLFDATPTERVSKVYFEDKLFETWNHGRTVVIGDGMYHNTKNVALRYITVD